MLVKRQSVRDIMAAVMDAHSEYAEDYDSIAVMFLGRHDEQTLRNIYNFLKLNVDYEEEGDEMQVVKSPSAIIETGVNDCKCFSLFVGGVLGALSRMGSDIDWNYAFASYDAEIRTPGHVFVQARTREGEFWIDPVLANFNQRYPVPKHLQTRKTNDMALYKLSGVGCACSESTTKEVSRVSAVPSGAGFMDWVKANPALSVGAAVLLFYLFTSKKR